MTLENGALRFQAGSQVVLEGVRPYIKIGERTVSGDLEGAGMEEGRDQAGTYHLERYKLKVKEPSAGIVATLELRHYLKPEVLVATLEYRGPAPSAQDGVQVGMHFPDFGRGMALHRLKLWWTTPTFVSDPRLLAGANQLLLWQQMGGDGYHLLVPLAGDGMVGELGVYDFENFRVSLSSHDPTFAPHRIPLFAYCTGGDPYRLAPAAYTAAFAAGKYYGRLRWQKSYPEIYRYLGWCSWNTYYHDVTTEKVIDSVRSLREKKIPIGFVLVDDGWLSIHNSKLTGYEADPAKFPHGLAGLVRTLRHEYNIPHVGVWHTLQGYWQGVDPDSEIGRAHTLFAGDAGKYVPDPRHGAGESFFADWYRSLTKVGIDFVKVDNQGSMPQFTDGLLPLFISGEGEERNLQEAASKYLRSGPEAETSGSIAGTVNLLNCMSMALENVFNWRVSNLARSSEDYFPDVLSDTKDHIFYNAYNAYWMSNFAYPDWDMFETQHEHGEYQAFARAISGGPVYTTDSPGKERPELLLPLAFSDGRLLMLDWPAEVTRDVLLRDTSLEPVPLKVFGTVTRPGYKAGMIGAFNVDKTAKEVTGALRAADVEGLADVQGAPGLATVAVYGRKADQVTVLDAQRPEIPLTLGEYGHDLFTLVPVEKGAAVFGLLDKYIGPAAVVAQRHEGSTVEVPIREGGEFGAYLKAPPASVEIDGKTLAKNAYTYANGLLRIPAASFGSGTGEREVRIVLAAK